MVVKRRWRMGVCWAACDPGCRTHSLGLVHADPGLWLCNAVGVWVFVGRRVTQGGAGTRWGSCMLTLGYGCEAPLAYGCLLGGV